MNEGDPHEPSIELSIETKDGRLEPTAGSKWPELRDGIIGRVLLPASAVVDSAERARLLRRHKREILAAGTALLVNVHPQRAPPGPLADWAKGLDSKEVEGSPGGYFVQLTLLEPLALSLRGEKLPALSPARCDIPSLTREVGSVNQGYTRISERYEPHRVSHTGNVFEKVFFHDTALKRWRPLAVLR